MFFHSTKTELATITIHILKLLYWVSLVVAIRKCSDQQFSVLAESGTIGCRDCPSCPEGYEVTPACGTEILHNASIGCVPCVAGKTFSDTLGVRACHTCGICSKGRVIKHNCTQQSQIVCGNRCTDKDMYFNGHTGDCQPCSQCCNDGSDMVIEECREKGMVLGMQCSTYDKSRCQKPSTPDNLSTMAPGQVAQSDFDISSTMAPTEVTVVTKKQKPTAQSTEGRDEAFPHYLIVLIIAVFVGSSVCFVVFIKRKCSQRNSRSDNSQPSQNCWRRGNNRNCSCIQLAEEGRIMEGHQMTERQCTQGNNSSVGSISTTEENATGCSSDQKNNRGLTDLENELSGDVDKSENDPLIVSPPTEEIEHNTNSSPNLLSGDATAQEESNQIENGSTAYQEHQSSEDVDKKKTQLKELTSTPQGYKTYERVLKHMDHFTENGGYLYEKVADQFGVEKEDVWEFEKEYKRPGGSPSNQLFQYLGAKDPTLTVEQFIDGLLEVEHAGKNKVAELLQPFV